MTTRLTLFTATLVQDSALTVSGLDRETSADQPFALVESIIDGERTLVPTLVGRGLKGAVVAMGNRFFDPLPSAVSDSVRQDRPGALRRSAWEFADATAVGHPCLRAGVGIRQKTGARAGGVLYDREVIPAGTKWHLSFRVDWSQIPEEVRADEGSEAEGILGYVLAEHWAEGRCWLGGGAARGLGWCHIDDLTVFSFDEANYETWVAAGRPREPKVPSVPVPIARPTRSWCFRSLDVDVCCGEYTPEPDEPAWGLDMLAIGPHESERTLQPTGDGNWAKPAWAPESEMPVAFATDRALVMEDGRPLLPGSSLRGPLRHAFSRRENRQAGQLVAHDPNLGDTKISEEDSAGRAFGTVSKSSRILIRDARAKPDWAAAKLHMHAEDEFSAGSYGSAKRDAVRMLRGSFPVRIVVEGAEPDEVDWLVARIDREIALGGLGHLPIGGHKTRGAGFGQWRAAPWDVADVRKVRDWAPAASTESPATTSSSVSRQFPELPKSTTTWVCPEHGGLESAGLTLGEATQLARAALNEPLVAWWCDPAIDLAITSPPQTFGRAWPDDDNTLNVDEVAFYAERSVWRAARTSRGARFVLIKETDNEERGAKRADVVYTPARLHGSSRFSSMKTDQGSVLLREWRVGNEVLGFTLNMEQR